MYILFCVTPCLELGNLSIRRTWHGVYSQSSNALFMGRWQGSGGWADFIESACFYSNTVLSLWQSVWRFLLATLEPGFYEYSISTRKAKERLKAKTQGILAKHIQQPNSHRSRFLEAICIDGVLVQVDFVESNMAVWGKSVTIGCQSSIEAASAAKITRNIATVLQPFLEISNSFLQRFCRMLILL